MITWIKSVLPRISKYAVNLDKTELLVDKTWVWLGFQKGYSTFHFLRDNRLLITRLGNVQEGQWEFIGSQLLHVKGINFNVMLNHGILFEGVLIIQKQGVVDGYELLFDEAIIPNGDVVSYVNSKLDNQIEQTPTIQNDYPITVYINDHELTIPSQPEIGLRINSNTTIYNGKINGLPSFMGVIIENNIVVSVFFEAKIETDQGEIEIEIKNLNWIHPKGSAFMRGVNTLPDGKYNILNCEPSNLDWKTISFQDGNLISVGYLDNAKIIMLACGVIFFVIIIWVFLLNN
jgi:hypothetical protein